MNHNADAVLALGYARVHDGMCGVAVLDQVVLKRNCLEGVNGEHWRDEPTSVEVLGVTIEEREYTPWELSSLLLEVLHEEVGVVSNLLAQLSKTSVRMVPMVIRRLIRYVPLLLPQTASPRSRI